jgi:hypothetical protein
MKAYHVSSASGVLEDFHAPFPWSGSTSSSSPLGGESSMDDLPGSSLVDMLILLYRIKSERGKTNSLAWEARRRCGTGMTAFGNELYGNS